MNYHDLKKLATPGSFVVSPRSWDKECTDICISDDEHRLAIATTFNEERSRQDATLIAHCVNNFDKALVLLEELQEYVSDTYETEYDGRMEEFCTYCGKYKTDGEPCPDSCLSHRMPKLIAELENVEY